MKFARQLFEDQMLYKSSDRMHFANSRVFTNVVGWDWMPEAVKEKGWIGRNGQYFLDAERRAAALSYNPLSPAPTPTIPPKKDSKETTPAKPVTPQSKALSPQSKKM